MQDDNNNNNNSSRLLGDLATFEAGEVSLLLENRNQNLGSMFVSEFALDYIQILYRLLMFRREHELEVLRDELFDAVKTGISASRNNELYPIERFDQEMKQLEEWNLVNKRLEKTRLRSYKDVRRDRFRFSLTDETIAFLTYLEDRHQNDLLPRDDDSLNLLEFILSALKQINKALKEPEENHASIVFSMCDVQEKTARLSQNLNRITVTLGNFLLKVYSPEEAKEIVSGLDVYFKSYLMQLSQLRMKILNELERLTSGEKSVQLQQCFTLFLENQRRLPRIMQVSRGQENAADQILKLLSYYQRNGRVDKLCGTVHDNAMKVLGKLTSFLKELERRSNRLELINIRLQELTQKAANYEPQGFLWAIIGSAAAPLDMNDSDDYHKAEPPAPRSSHGTRRTPPKTFSRTRPLSEKHVETHEEMRTRMLLAFIKSHYPQHGKLDDTELSGAEDFQQLTLLLKYGILGEGRQLKKVDLKLNINQHQEMSINGNIGKIQGPETILEEFKHHG